MSKDQPTARLSFKSCVMAAFYSSLFTFTIPGVATAYSEHLRPPHKIDTNTMVPLQVGHATPVVTQMLQAAAATKEKTLWSMYPASVRGRVFEAGSMFGGGW